MLDGLSGAVKRHKEIGKGLIYSSEIEATIKTKSQTPVTISGASMFAPLVTETTYTSIGPFKCTWIDAATARATQASRVAEAVSRYDTAEIVAKFWLEDVLVNSSEPYGATYFDQADHVVVNGKRYQVLGYERYGLGVTQPYMISVILEGSYTSDG